MSALKFIKMHGLGNDFVILDGRGTPIELNSAQTQAIADRRRGIGCDQLILLEESPGEADLKMRIRNADGGEVEACGNATRCVGKLVMDEKGRDQALIETLSGVLTATRSGDNITVDMGPAYLDWQDIPLASEMDTLSLDISEGPLSNPVGVGVGNPHAVFFVEDCTAINLESVGPILEHHPLFPNRTNVEAAEIISRSHIRLRVWERGVGITEACGTGACATLVAAVRRDLADRKAKVELDGGTLEIEWRDDNRIMMTGPTEMSYTGTWVL
ncbi:MAG: diaminopimelate epimerase [Rhodospirillaceae bacterium]|jgi:diaminopimelate epimerase|nr:diaminopimelate epimerase [Rhodospirillaceae bacterium]MBT4590111.1 diaminopimelate epimerase [Rhodospirillaceae bacterium]MBT7266547.1 diaminopimelate epimerase [Rhodospirillaceae bacterium]